MKRGVLAEAPSGRSGGMPPTSLVEDCNCLVVGLGREGTESLAEYEGSGGGVGSGDGAVLVVVSERRGSGLVDMSGSLSRVRAVDQL